MVDISVIIPVYNTEQYLEDCLMSVLNQTYSNIEIICVEDCSTDSSAEVLERVKNKDERINVLYNKVNSGLAKTRNVGAKVAKGEYIFFLDSDDMLENFALEKLYIYSKKYELDILYFNTKHVLESEKIKDFSKYKSEHLYYTEEPIQGKNLFVEFMKRRDFDHSVCRQFYRRQFLEEENIHFREGMLHEDTLFSLQAILKAHKVCCVPLQCHIYKRRENSITTSTKLSTNRLLGKLTIHKEVCEIQNEYEKEVREQLNSFLMINCRQIIQEFRTVDAFDKKLIKENIDVFQNLQFMTCALYGGFFPYKLAPEIMQKIREKKHVIIYGAGQVGNSLKELLDERAVNVTCFAVTKLGDRTVYDGCSIFEIDTLIEYCDSAIVLIASLNYAENMEETAKSLGFKNIIKIL